MIRLNLSTVALTMLAAAGCGADAGSDQTVTGTINRSSFPDAVTHARAVGTLATVEAPIASDGTFTLHLPEHDRYRIELVSATRQSDLVFPRGSSLVDTSFYVEAARDNLALGAIRYIGDVGNAAHEGEGSGSDTGSAGGEEGGGSGDTSSGGSEEGGGSTCGGDVEEASGQSETGDAAIPETNPPTAIGCDDNEGEEGGGNGAPGSGGSEEGGGSSGGSEGGGSEGGGSEGGGSEGGGGSGGSEGGGGSEGSGGGSEGG